MLVLEETCSAVAIAALVLLHDFTDEGLVDRVASHSLEEVSVQSQLCRDVTKYVPPSWRDALRSHASGREHLQSNTRLRCSQVTTDQLGGSSLYQNQCKLMVKFVSLDTHQSQG
jgi:hypothetical protein